jgi:formylglycine-generating enzyme required for sulfatase activity
LVAEKLPNSFGLFDMHGLLEEWCQDALWSYRASPIEGISTSTHRSTRRVFRGGSLFAPATSCRSGCRSSWPPHFRLDFLGARVARSLDVR